MLVKIAVIDVPLICDYIEKICAQGPRCEVIVKCAENGEAWELIQHGCPEVVLIDLSLRGERGLGLARRIADELPHVRCAFMSLYCTEFMVAQVERGQAAGFIDKSRIEPAEIVSALETITSGKRYFSERYQQVLRGMWSNPATYTKILTDREQEVLSLVGCSLSDQEIAERLGISVRTAETHRRNLLGKLRVGSTSKLIQYAISHGVVQLGSLLYCGILALSCPV